MTENVIDKHRHKFNTLSNVMDQQRYIRQLRDWLASKKPDITRTMYNEYVRFINECTQKCNEQYIKNQEVSKHNTSACQDAKKHIISWDDIKDSAIHEGLFLATPALENKLLDLQNKNYTDTELAQQLADVPEGFIYYFAMTGIGMASKTGGQMTFYFRLLNTSSNRGHLASQYFLGLAYSGGSGVKQDIDLAKKWLVLAKNQGLKDAETELLLIEQFFGT